MSTVPHSATLPATLPWSDRGETRGERMPSPRSPRDLEILRGLGRRINRADPGALNNLGVVYFSKGMIEEAVRCFEDALDLDARMTVAERNLQIAYFGTGFYETLVRELRARIEVDPEDAVARNRLARVYYYGGDSDAAIREWREVLHTRPRDAGVYESLARAETKRGDLDGALIALRNAAAIQPRNPRIHLRIGEVLYLRGLHADAREPLEKAVALDDTLAEAHHLLAFVYGDLGLEERAGAAAARAAELNPGLSRVERNLSLDRYSEARYEELVGDRSDRMTVAAGGALAHYNMGLAFRQKALWEEALREFRLATERGEDPFLVRQAQAEMMLLRGTGEDAVAQYEELLEQEPASPKLWNELGVARHQTGELAGAEQAYQRALALDPTYPLAWNNLAVALHHRGADDTEEAFRSALSDGRAANDVWRNLGLFLQRTGRREEAIVAYRSAVDNDANAALAWTGLGTLYLEQNAPERAREALLRAVETDPELAEARYQLAFALSALGDYPGALRETQRALELNPYIPQPRFRLLIDLQYEEAGVLAPDLDAPAHVGPEGGVATFEFREDSLDHVFGDAPTPPVQEAGAGQAPAEPDPLAPSAPESIGALAGARALLDRGDPVAASTHARRAEASGANRIEVLLLQGEIYLARGLAGEAIERFEEAEREIARLGERAVAAVAGEDAMHRALLGLARSYTELDRTREAVEAAERLRALSPDALSVHLTLADALLRAGDASRAVRILESARQVAPDDVALLVRLGRALLARGDTDRAERAFRDAVARNSQAFEARVALGRLLAGANRLEEAAAEFRAALDRLPSYGEAALGLAELEASRGNGDAAVNALVDVLTVDPYHLPALVRLGDMLCRFGRQKEAAVAYRRVLRFDPGYVEALLGLERLSPEDDGGPSHEID